MQNEVHYRDLLVFVQLNDFRIGKYWKKKSVEVKFYKLLYFRASMNWGQNSLRCIIFLSCMSMSIEKVIIERKEVQ